MAGCAGASRAGARFVASAGAALLLAQLGSGARADDAEEALATAQERLSYSAGYAFGAHLADLERRGEGVELETVFRGVLDALSGADPLLSESQRSAALQELAAPADSVGGRAEPGRERPVAPARRLGFRDDYAALNAKRAGVVVLASGVQYEVLEAGSGAKPSPTGAVRVSYQGSLSDGEVFDSTWDSDEPILLRLDEIVVPGLREALLHMREGDRWRVVIPPAMGFARAGNNMLRRRDLIYEIELVSVEAQP